EELKKLWSALEPIHPLLELIGKAIGIALISPLIVLVGLIRVFSELITATLIVALYALEAALKVVEIAFQVLLPPIAAVVNTLVDGFAEAGRVIFSWRDDIVSAFDTVTSKVWPFVDMMWEAMGNVTTAIGWVRDAFWQIVHAIDAVISKIKSIPGAGII